MYLTDASLPSKITIFRAKGVNLALGQKVQKFEGENGKVTRVVTEKGYRQVNMTYQNTLFDFESGD